MIFGKNDTLVKYLDSIFTNSSLGSRLLHRLNFNNLRHVFYLITPYETSVPTINEVPNYNIQVIFKFLLYYFFKIKLKMCFIGY